MIIAWIMLVLVTVITACGSAPSPIERAGAANRSDRPLPVSSPATFSAPAAQPVQPGVIEPMRLHIPRLEIDVAVVPTGVASDGQMALPERVDQAGWYRFGPAPGASTGSAVLAGHVDSRRYGVGPLSRLSSGQPGDEIAVQRRDGSVVAYRVVSVAQVDKRGLPVDQVFVRDGTPTLRILTCGGPYSPGAGYRDNVVVTAQPMGEQ
jgi:Sortase domain